MDKLSARFFPPLLFALALALAWCRPAAAQEMPKVKLSAGIHLINAELAADDQNRQRGLMFREKMPAGEGMLFVFDQAAVHCMWMKNTLLPLSVAFIDVKGTILNIEDMKPQTLDSHCAKQPATFALEMNLGWFKQRGIKAGMKIGGAAELLEQKK
jgi:uncharacterized protein